MILIDLMLSKLEWRVWYTRTVFSAGQYYHVWLIPQYLSHKMYYIIDVESSFHYIIVFISTQWILITQMQAIQPIPEAQWPQSQRLQVYVSVESRAELL